jgi:hypothetical protein
LFSFDFFWWISCLFCLVPTSSGSAGFAMTCAGALLRAWIVLSRGVPPMHGSSCCWGHELGVPGDHCLVSYHPCMAAVVVRGMDWVLWDCRLLCCATPVQRRLSLGAGTGCYGDAQGEGGCMHPPCTLLFCGARSARRGTRRAQVSVYSPHRTFSLALIEKHEEMWDRSNPPHQLPSVHKQRRAPRTPLSGRLRFGLSPLFLPWPPRPQHRQEHTPFKLILSLWVH